MFSSAVRTAASRFVVRASISSRSTAMQQPLAGGVRFFGTAFLNPAEVQERIITVVKNFDKVDPNKVTSTAKFSDDLGLDSLDAVEVVMAIEDEFAIEIPDAEADRIASIGDAVEYVAAHPMAK